MNFSIFSNCNAPILFRNLQKRYLSSSERGPLQNVAHYGSQSDLPRYNLIVRALPICNTEIDVLDTVNVNHYLQMTR
jgi:hypothetical protein